MVNGALIILSAWLFTIGPSSAQLRPVEQRRVYNIEVGGNPIFFTGSGALLVHNVSEGASKIQATERASPRSVAILQRRPIDPVIGNILKKLYDVTVDTDEIWFNWSEPLGRIETLVAAATEHPKLPELPSLLEGMLRISPPALLEIERLIADGWTFRIEEVPHAERGLPADIDYDKKIFIVRYEEVDDWARTPQVSVPRIGHDAGHAQLNPHASTQLPFQDFLAQEARGSVDSELWALLKHVIAETGLEGWTDRPTLTYRTLGDEYFDAYARFERSGKSQEGGLQKLLQTFAELRARDKSDLDFQIDQLNSALHRYEVENPRRIPAGQKLVLADSVKRDKLLHELARQAWANATLYGFGGRDATRLSSQANRIRP